MEQTKVDGTNFILTLKASDCNIEFDGMYFCEIPGGCQAPG